MLRVDKMTCLEDNEVILDVNLALFNMWANLGFFAVFPLKKVLFSNSDSGMFCSYKCNNENAADLYFNDLVSETKKYYIS